ncbi:MAG: WXG100 family type VII secretion target [Defluviitaleaceae bacterium]|nr:WXG100 family type VII secretion target [Defluviitaleaceae bacterium]
MAGQIRMTPEQMRGRASDVRTQGENFQDVINRMQNIINELQTEWEGAASRSFEAQFTRLKPSFNEMRQLIDDIGTQLDATANAVEQLDQDIAARFS